MNCIKPKYKIFIVTCLALLFNTILPAQNYPIKATLQVTPPYSGYLLDYTDESNEKLKVLLTLNDINVNSYAVKLLFSIEGNGYSIKTKSTYLANPISLQGGVPELLGAYELNAYFATQNLLFTGLNTNIYEQNKSLPEGYYTISVTAYDYSSAEPKQVSNTATTSAWFTLSDPPQPISPNCGEQINLATSSSQVIFQWLNQSISPYGQNNTEYVLQLFEVRPDTKNPNDAMQSSFPVFSTTLEQPIFVYGPAEIPLIEGMLYAWRIKAQDKNGRLAYKNNGYSTVCTFRYGSKYAALESQVQLTLQANVQTHRMVMASWDSIPEFTDYTLLYKKASGTYNWREVKLSEARKKIADLEPNTTYQAKVKGHVEDYTSPESNTVTFTTLPAPSFTCSSNNTQLNPAELNVPLLQQATQDMIFTVGLFEMQVTQITGSNGQFSGKGIMFKGVFKLPVLVQFNNITVNQNQVVIDGEVNAITSPKSLMVADLDVVWENIQELLNELNTQIANGNISQAAAIADSIVKMYPDTNKTPELAVLKIEASECSNECDGSGSIIKSFGGRGSFTPLEFPSSDCIANCYAEFQNAVKGNAQNSTVKNCNTINFSDKYFIAPNGLAFKLPAGAKPINTVIGRDGVLGAFSTNSQIYKASATTNLQPENNFYGYKQESGSSIILNAQNDYISNINTACLVTNQNNKINIYEANFIILTNILYHNKVAGNFPAYENSKYLCTVGAGTNNGVVNTTNNNELLADYSAGADGNSKFNQAQKTQFETQLNEFKKELGCEVKLYVIDSQNQKAAEAEQKANADKNSKCVIIARINNNEVTLDYSLNISWLPTASKTCVDSYIAEAITKYKNSAEYISANLFSKIAEEVSIVIYKTIFGTVYCATEEQTLATSNSATQYTGGAIHELMSSADLEQMAAGLATAITSFADITKKSYIDYFKNLSASIAASKNSTSPVNTFALLGQVTPPNVTITNEIINGTAKIASGFKNIYITNGNAYKYGELTVMIVPIIITGGEWIGMKAATISARLASMGSKADEVLALLKNAEKQGYTIVEETNKITIKNGGEILTTIEKKADNEVRIVTNGAGNDLLTFVNKSLSQKLDDIAGIWNTKYPIQEMLEGRSFFEDIMGHYRYAKSTGWNHTGDISEFFKGVDFYKGTTQGANIFAETAVSMKTTITTNVDNWMASAPIQKNLQFLNQGKSVDGLLSNGKTMFIANAEIHVYMPKANITEALKSTWMNKLNTTHPGIKFEIKALEDFVN